MSQEFQHWHLEKDADQIVWLSIDRAGSAVNTMNREVMGEFDQILDQIASDNSCKGLVIQSAKRSGFIAGADITQFNSIKSVEEAFDIMRLGQGIFSKLENLKIPTVAMIQGFCVGGGMELVLACDYRITDDERSTKLGLPEIKLGIQPGWGGTVRLPRLVGAPAAMDMILTGRLLSGSAGKRVGFVDAVVPERNIHTAARHYVLNKPKKHTPNLFKSMTNSAIIRPLLARFLRYQVGKKAKIEHYPAPYAVIDQWSRVGVDGNNAYLAEAHSISSLVMTDTSRNLVRVFFLQERLKSLAKAADFKANHVHVIGAGVMGGDIAAWCALRGMRVTLQDREAKFIAPAVERAYKLFKKKLKKPRLIQAAMDRLMPDMNGDGVKGADVIIEAIFENLEAKQALFKELEAKAKPTAILATNTSSIPLDEINTVLNDPQRLVGIHFFNPVAMLPLVEIVKGEQTSQAIVDQATSFVGQIDKLPLPVKSSPGFLVNRVLMPYLMEAMTLLSEGFMPEIIDKAAEDFGMPMGPVELADSIGLDVAQSVAKYLGEYFGGKLPAQLNEMVERGEVGRKSGKGFYKYNKKKKPIKKRLSKSADVPKDLADRMVMRMVNEAMSCLREKVVGDADLLDAGMIFGTGFAPFRGGPINYAKSIGVEQFSNRMQELANSYGERFKADEGWHLPLD